MTIALYLDEDTQRNAFVRALRAAQVDVVTVSEVNRTGYSDAEQLTWATDHQRTVYTFNVKDFCQLHNQYLIKGKSHSGIIVTPRQNYSIGQQLQAIQSLLNVTSASTITNQLIFLSNYF
jgi:hypothetical protein